MRGKFANLLAVVVTIQLFTTCVCQVATSTEFDSRVVQTLFVRNKTILASTAAGSLYVTYDDGTSWLGANTKLFDSDKFVGIHKGVRRMYQSKVDADRIILEGWGTWNWLTKDGGHTFSSIRSNRMYLQFKLHPTQPDWYMALALSGECFSRITRNNCNYEMYVSKDFGTSEVFIEKYVRAMDWGWAGSRNVSEETMYIDTYTTHTGFQRKLPQGNAVLMKYVGIRKSERTTSVILRASLGFYFSPRFVFAVTLDHNNQQAFHVSMDSITFIRSTFPVALEKNSQFTILNMDDAIFLSYHPGNGLSSYGTLYVSDAIGSNFVKSMDYIARAAPHRYYFSTINGVEGHYLANQVANPVDIGPSIDPVNRTLISFDNGGEWTPVRRPEALTCDETVTPPGELQLPCALQLSLTGNAPLSTAKAAGLLIAGGNTGFQYSSIEGMFFSRDGGLVWRNITNAPHIVSIGYHGTVIVLAPRGVTSALFFTTDEFTTPPRILSLPSVIQVTSIITEPDLTSRRFLLYGTDASGAKGRVIHVNFEELNFRDCQGDDAPDTQNSDYETWQVDDGRRKDKCLLGHEVVYTRKKPTAQCFDKREDHKKITLSHCKCAYDDYECDYGFERKGDVDGSMCDYTQESGTVEDLPKDCRCVNTTGPLVPPHCKPGMYFVASIGYRRIAGDTCDYTTGLNLLNFVQYPCPLIVVDDNNKDDFQGNNLIYLYISIALLLVAAGVVIGIGAGCYMRKRSEEQALLESAEGAPMLEVAPEENTESAVTPDGDAEPEINLEVKTKNSAKEEEEDVEVVPLESDV